MQKHGLNPSYWGCLSSKKKKALKPGKWLELDNTDDPDLQSHFPSTLKGVQHDHQVYKLDQICIKKGV